MGFRHVASTDVKIAHQVRGQIDAGNCREPVLKFLHSDFECLHHSLLCFNEVNKRKQRKVAAASEVCSRVLTLEANFSPSFGFQINFKRWSSLHQARYRKQVERDTSEWPREFGFPKHIMKPFCLQRANIYRSTHPSSQDYLLLLETSRTVFKGPDSNHNSSQ